MSFGLFVLGWRLAYPHWVRDGKEREHPEGYCLASFATQPMAYRSRLPHFIYSSPRVWRKLMRSARSSSDIRHLGIAGLRDCPPEAMPCVMAVRSVSGV